VHLPNAQLRSTTTPSTRYDPVYEVAAQTSLWIIQRTTAGDWLMMETASGRRYWLPAEDVDLDVALESIPIQELQ
jgi:hypothetical protein